MSIRSGLIGILVSISATAVIAEDNGQTRTLFKGPLKFSDRSKSDRYRKDTWKVNYDDYLYKRFHPMLHEKYPYEPQKLPGPGGTYKALARWKDRFSGKRPIFSCRLFAVPEKAAKLASIRIYRQAIIMPDWKGYDLIRTDIKTSKDTLIWWGMIDTKIQPPVVGNFNTRAGVWQTLEIDLEQAVKDRKLDLAKMSATWMYAPPDVGGEIANLRLVKRSVKPRHALITDLAATKLPETPPQESAPKPDIKPDLTPLKAPRTMTFHAPWETRIFKTKDRFGHHSGSAAIFDQNHVFLIYTLHKAWTKRTGSKVPYYENIPISQFFAAQSLDGGNTWSGIDGDKDPTHLFIDRATYFKLIDARGDIIEWNQNGCQSGPAGPWHRLRKYTFLGSKGWTRWNKDRVLDEEARHCTHGAMDFVRTPDGRIWGALGIEGRWYPEMANVHAKYSDTDGKHWLSWNPGFTSRIPGMDHQHPVGITSYRGHVAIVKINHFRSRLSPAWTFFDGKKWSKPEPFPTRYIRSVSSTGKNDEVLVVATYASQGVVRWDGDGWKTELKARVSLCRSGSTLMALAVDPKKNVLNVYHRLPSGRWDGPEAVDMEPAVDVYVPRFCPPNLGAVIYVPKANRKTIKVLMVPNKLWKAQE